MAMGAKYFKRLLVLVDRATPRETRRTQAALEKARDLASLEEIETALREVKGGKLSFAEVDPVFEALMAQIYEAARVQEMGVAMRESIFATLSTAITRTGPLATAELAVLIDGRLNWPTFQARAIRWARTSAAEKVVEITEALRGSLRDLVAQGFTEDLPLPQLAREIRDIIPANSQMSRALGNYRDDVEKAILDGTITRRRGNQLVEIYRKRQVRYRANTISTTELVEGTNATQTNIWEQAVEQKVFGAEDWVQEWIGILRDGRICKWCHALHGQRRKIGEDFEDPITGLKLPGPTRHVKCRCQKRLVQPDDDPASTAPFVEPKEGGDLRPLVQPR